MGWYGSEPLNSAFQDTPCGCALAREALEGPEIEQEPLLEVAKEAQRCWSCPNAGFSLGKENLSPGAREALVSIERLTGASQEAFETCPLHYLGDNTETGRDCNRAWEARQHHEKGQLALVEGEAPSKAILDAVEAINASIARYERYLTKTAKEKAESERERRKSFRD